MITRRRQSGFSVSLILYGLLAIGVATAVGSVIYTYTKAIRDAEYWEDEAGKKDTIIGEKNEEIARLTFANEVEKGKREAEALRHDAEIERIQASRDRQLENEVRKERAVAKANEDRIAATLNRDPARYLEFVNKVIPYNLETLRCRSDLRTVGDEDACPRTVR